MFNFTKITPHISTELSIDHVLPLISVCGTYLILKLQGTSFIVGRHFKDRSAYFKVRRVIHMKFQIFGTVFFQITVNKYQCNR